MSHRLGTLRKGINTQLPPDFFFFPPCFLHTRTQTYCSRFSQIHTLDHHQLQSSSPDSFYLIVPRALLHYRNMPSTTVPVAPRLATAARSGRRSPSTPPPAVAATTTTERILERRARIMAKLNLPKLNGMFCFAPSCCCTLLPLLLCALRPTVALSPHF